MHTALSGVRRLADSGAQATPVERPAASGVVPSRVAAIAASISCYMRAQVPSHDVCARNASAWRQPCAADPRPARPRTRRDELVGASSAIRTSPLSPYGRTTSRIDVETTGLPAARYSGVLVGLMKRVASLRANGSSATSQPAR